MKLEPSKSFPLYQKDNPQARILMFISNTLAVVWIVCTIAYLWYKMTYSERVNGIITFNDQIDKAYAVTILVISIVLLGFYISAMMKAKTRWTRFRLKQVWIYPFVGIVGFIIFGIPLFTK